MRLTAFIFALLSFALTELGTARDAATQFEGHTPPNFWDGPRIFHRPFKADETPVISIARRPYAGTAPEGHVPSPNQAYWYALSGPDSGPQELTVYSERNEVTVVTWSLIDRRYSPKLNWINEKLLYGEVWTGRIRGEVFLVDAEAGRLLLHEKVLFGQIHFQQWRQGCEAFPNTPGCKKPKGLP